MITEIRRNLKTSKALSVVGIFTVLALGGVFSIPMLLRQASSSGPWAINVSGSKISYKEFSQEVALQQEFINQIRSQYGQFADMLFAMHGMTADPKMIAKDKLVKQELIFQLADACGVQVSHDYIVEKINDKEFVSKYLTDIIPPFVFDQNGSFKRDTLQIYLKKQGLSMASFEEKVVRGLYRAIVLSFVEATLYTPSYDVEYVAKMEHATKRFSLVSISLDDYVKKIEKNTPASKDEVQTYFDACNASAKKYWVPEKRNGTSWTFSPKSYDINITDDMINGYYEDNKTTRFAGKPAQIEIRYILIPKDFGSQEGIDPIDYLRKKREELLVKPSLFADMAKEISIDSSAQNGGLLKPFARGEREVAVERAAFVLQHDGDISDVLTTNEGYALVQRVSKKQRTFKPLESVRSDIKKTLAEDMFKELFLQEVKEILKNEDPVQRAAALKDFVAQRKGSKEPVSVQLASANSTTKRLFDIGIGDVTFVAEKGKGVLIQLDSIESSSLPALSTIYDVVSHDFYEERAQKHMQEDIITIKKRMKEESLETLSKEYPLAHVQRDWSEKTTKKEKDSHKGPFFDEYGISLTEIKDLEVVGGSIIHQEPRMITILRLDRIDSSNEKPTEESLTKTKQSLNQEYMRLTTEGLVASLYRNATIETNKEVTFQVEDLLYE